MAGKAPEDMEGPDETSMQSPITSLAVTQKLRKKRHSAAKQRGRENKGPLDIAPKSFS